MSLNEIASAVDTPAPFIRQVQDNMHRFAAQVSRTATRLLPANQSTGLMGIGFVVLVMLVMVTSNTRAVISPFYEMSPIWVFFSICAYAIGFTFSKFLTTNARVLRPFFLTYFFMSIFFLLMFITPNSDVFNGPILRSSTGIFSLLFLSMYAGILCGDAAQSDALGDAYFRAHVLPQLQSHKPPISLLCCDFSGGYQLIDSTTLDIRWNSSAQELHLNGYPLWCYVPVFVEHRHLSTAKEKFLDLINNQPRTKREAMRHYVRNTELGEERFKSIYCAFHLGIQNPLALTKPARFIDMERSKFQIGTTDYTLQWSIPAKPWSQVHLDDRPVLNQAIDPMNLVPSEARKIRVAELGLVQHMMPDFCGEHVELGVAFNQSFIHFLLAFRRGEYQPESRMRVMQAVCQWVLNYRRRAPSRPEGASPARTVSIGEWLRVEQRLSTEGVSLFMDMYNWLNEYVNVTGAESGTALEIESLIQDGFSVVRSHVEQPVSAALHTIRTGLGYGADVSEKNIKLHATTLNWIFFAISMVDFEELPV
jgi:hypothetical protein